jgi:competence ComEA-like helix-hairpin-helix protein
MTQTALLAAVRLAGIGVFLLTGVATAQVDAPVTDKRQAVLQKVCSTCHAMDEVTTRRSRSQWEDLLYKMIDLGAKGTDQEFRTILNYLAGEHGRVNVNRGSASELSTVLGLTKQQAASVVAHRREHGKFENFDAFSQTPGIDAGRLESLRDAISY